MKTRIGWACKGRQGTRKKLVKLVKEKRKEGKKKWHQRETNDEQWEIELLSQRMLEG